MVQTRWSRKTAIAGRLGWLGATLSAALVIACAPEQPAPSAVGQQPLAPVDVEQPQILISFIAGQATVETTDGNRGATIGEVLRQDETIAVQSGYVELQIGAIGAVRIDEGSVVRMSRLAFGTTGSEIELGLDAGVIFNKIESLAGTSDYRVRTQTTVAGVRGTEFAVYADARQAVRVVVREGSVAVTPAAADLSPQTVPAALATAVADAVPVVEADQTLSIGPELAAELASEFQPLIDLIGTTEAGAALAPQDSAAATAAVERIRTRTAPLIAALTPGDAAEVAALDGIRVLTAAPTATDATPVLIPVAVQVDPPEAQISIDGQVIGRQGYSGLFVPGSELTLRFEAAGFAPEQIDLVLDQGSGVQLEVELVALTGATDPATEPETTQAAQPSEQTVAPAPSVDLVRVTLAVQPGDAQISLDGSTVQTGQITFTAPAGDSVQVRTSRAGFADTQQTIQIPDRPAEIQIVMEPQPIERVDPVADRPFVRSLVSTETGTVFGADSAGTVYAVDRDGNLQWRLATENGGNENAAPVLSGNRLAFSGAGEFVIVNATDGTVVHREAIAGARSHLFGRRAVPTGDGWLYPGDQQLLLLDAAGRTTGRSIELPGSSSMSPALAGDRVVIANQRGEVLVLDLASGAVVHTIATSMSQPVAHAAAVVGDRAFIGGRRGTVAAVDVVAGTVLWERELPGQRSIFVDPVVSNEVVFLFDRSQVVALGIGDGQLRYALPDATGVPVEASGELYYTTTSGELVRFDRASGAVTARLELPAQPVATSTAHQDRIAIPLVDGTVVTIHTAGIVRNR